MPNVLAIILGVSFVISGTLSAAESVCFGTVSNGRLENGVQLPQQGGNFIAYSSVGVTLGRTYVHSKVAEIIGAAYHAIEQSIPGTTFVYGETGWDSGGKIKPHRTHRNGLSVDFMVPVIDATGHSVPLPTGLDNKFGYGIDFDKNARYQDFRIDFEAIAEHLYQLDIAAKARSVGIALVIFDPPYVQRLYKTKRGKYLRSNIKFMLSNAWVRHDEHYHVDFALPCKPLRG
ncbi:MAG: penicillin-insensitive murein endopeptidase [Gammaproteobacteria bacterium]|nr:penicillin-insensitive murein endopeptidase [Gammaproteobacteria bacterium]